MPSALKLTPIHFAVHEFIIAFKQDHDGVAPTVLEIGDACKINSTSAVRHYLDSLVLFGMIEWEGNIYSPLNRADRVPSVPYIAE